MLSLALNEDWGVYLALDAIGFCLLMIFIALRLFAQLLQLKAISVLGGMPFISTLLM